MPFQFHTPQMPAFNPLAYMSGTGNPLDRLDQLPQLRAPGGEQRNQPLLNSGVNFASPFAQLQAGTGAQGPRPFPQLPPQPDARAPTSNFRPQGLPDWITSLPGLPSYQSEIPAWLLQPPGASGGFSGPPAAPPGMQPNMGMRPGGQQPMPDVMRANRVRQPGMNPDWIDNFMPPMQASTPMQPMPSPGSQLASIYNLPPPPGGPQPFNQDTVSQLPAIMALLAAGAPQAGAPSLPREPGPGSGSITSAPPPAPLFGQIDTPTQPAPIWNPGQMDAATNQLRGMQFNLPPMPGMDSSGAQGILNQMAPGFGARMAGQFQDAALPANAQQRLASYGQAVGQGLGGAGFANNLMGSQLDFAGGQRDALMRFLLPLLAGGM